MSALKIGVGMAFVVSLVVSSTASGGQAQAPPAPTADPNDPHAGHAVSQPAPASPQDDHAAHGSQPALPPGIPPITEADRAAAFPDVDGHAVHDMAVNSFVLFDQLEWEGGDGGKGVSWDSRGWIGRDRDRLWFRTEGLRHAGRLDNSQAHLMYGRAVARWWDLVAGIRHDVRPGPVQTWAAVGVQGLAPYWFHVEATAYLGAGGRTHFRFEAEQDLLFTNRLVLQPLAEIEVYGTSDPDHEMGAGLATADLGLRLRYEIRRQAAPYVGVTWARKFFRTAELTEAAGHRVNAVRVALGLRTWF